MPNNQYTELNSLSGHRNGVAPQSAWLRNIVAGLQSIQSGLNKALIHEEVETGSLPYSVADIAIPNKVNQKKDLITEPVLVEVVNPTTPVREVTVTNQPEPVREVIVTNQPEPEKHPTEWVFDIERDRNNFILRIVATSNG